MTGEVLSCLAYGGTLILYGALSMQACSGISPLEFISRNLKMESFLLPIYMAQLDLPTIMEFRTLAEKHCRDVFKFEIAHRFGLHEFEQARATYLKEMTAGKVILRPDLTK